MADDGQVDLIKQGVTVWNEWRAAHPNEVVNLEGADLQNCSLQGANLASAILTGSDLSKSLLYGANLSGARVDLAKLHGAQLCDADLRTTDFVGSDLAGANLLNADLSQARLYRSNLARTNLTGANLTGAELKYANFEQADLEGVRWKIAAMRGKCIGVRGLDSCYSNALFKRAMADQDFLDALEAKWSGSWRIVLFWAWGLLDYGRSMSRVAAFGFGIAALYGGCFKLWPSLLDLSGSANTWFTPFYFSIVTFTTLGFGDVKPRTLIGEILTSSEVIIGYITLGLLLAVLAEKLARRS